MIRSTKIIFSINFKEQFEMAVNHELAAKYNGMQLRDTTELNQATKVTFLEVSNFRNLR